MANFPLLRVVTPKDVMQERSMLKSRTSSATRCGESLTSESSLASCAMCLIVRFLGRLVVTRIEDAGSPSPRVPWRRQAWVVLDEETVVAPAVVAGRGKGSGKS